MEASGGSDDVFEVSSEPDTTAASTRSESANVCRAAAISTLLGGDRTAAAELSEPLGDLGFAPALRSGDVAPIDIDPFESLGRLWADDDRSNDESRIVTWRQLNEAGDPQAAVAFLVAVLGSPLERESAAAAAALRRQLAPIDRRRRWRLRRWPEWGFLLEELEYRGRDWPWLAPWFPAQDFGEGEDLETEPIKWDPQRWTELYARASRLGGDRYDKLLLVDFLVRMRLTQALRSPDPVTRSLAAAIFPPPDGGAGLPTAAESGSPQTGTVVSTMIHGTRGWKGDWWRPRPGNFHEFIHDNHRGNLYTGGARFSWSGAYRRGDREQAAIDFCDWAGDMAPGGVQTLFAHSYGGEIAARAVLQGAQVTELVLLSVPATVPVTAVAGSPLRVVDVRLRFDPVLALARTRQRLGTRPNVTEVLLNQWRLDHSASHEASVWLTEAVAERGAI